MSFNTIAKAAGDGDLHQRFVACAAAEGVEDPQGWVGPRTWQIATHPAVKDAYEYAVNSGLDAPGRRDDVVTDEVILTVFRELTEAKAAKATKG